MLHQFLISTIEQTSLSSGITSLSSETSNISVLAGKNLCLVGDMSFTGIFAIFILIAMGYAVIKVFFANLKRGGILLIQIAVGSLYMLSVPRGFIDGFTGWCKQVIALCLTTFLQSTILIAGLMVFKDNFLLGVGLMLSATEIPRIADQFGLDTSTRGNIMSSVYATQSIVNITKTIAGSVK